MNDVRIAPLIFTPMAAAQAKNHGGLESITVQVREDLLKALPLEEGEEYDINGFMFHVVQLGDHKSHENDYIIYPKDDQLMVDSVDWEENEPLDRGPMKGKSWLMPRPASLLDD